MAGSIEACPALQAKRPKKMRSKDGTASEEMFVVPIDMCHL